MFRSCRVSGGCSFLQSGTEGSSCGQVSPLSSLKASHLWHYNDTNESLIVSFRRSYYAANWASFTFNGLLNWIQQYHVSIELFSYWQNLSVFCMNQL